MSLNRRALFSSAAAVGGGVLAAACATPGDGARAQTGWSFASDALFNQPYIDVDEWRDAPARHRYVHGGFLGTEGRFSFYFPPREGYDGRFFQLVTPVPASENTHSNTTGEESYVGFALASRGYFVMSNQGGITATGSPGSFVDPTIAAYRVNAAAAEYSRTIAQEMYGAHRTYGYCFGGSGGALRTIGSVEAVQTWDGSVPFVMGTDHALPSMFTCRLHALRVAGAKLPQVVDAVDAGGSGDMYAGLNEEERAALQEATRMGFPPRTWFLHPTMGWGPFSNVFDIIVRNDPSYFTDFWSKPGYLGFNPPASLTRARLQHRSAVTRVIMTDQAAEAQLPRPALGYRGTVEAPTTQWRTFQDQWSSRPFPVAFQLRTPPPAGVNLQGAKMVLPGGASVSVCEVIGDKVMVLFTPVSGPQTALTSGVRVGDEITIDNSDVLAVQTYHRHVVPPPEYYGWSQFRGADGQPIYPQRPRPLGPLFALATAGSIHSGRYHGKMIVLETLMDEDAFPWQADWYRTKVRAHLGAATDSNYRLWFHDNALHTSVIAQQDPTRTVSYRGALYQALRDVAAWVERGVAPPQTTNYRVEDAQILVPATAAERRGIQPVIALTANGGARATVRVGQTVEFVGVIETPPGTGSVVAAAWDFDRSGAFAQASAVTPAPRVEVRRTHAFAAPGTYFVALRAASQREGDASTPYARVQNVARARVVVT